MISKVLICHWFDAVLKRVLKCSISNSFDTVPLLYRIVGWMQVMGLVLPSVYG